MNALIKIESREIGNAVIRTVNARELHAWLESGQEFRHWIKGRIDQYGFVENHDFTTSESFIRGGTAVDYHITIDMAKELSMVERNEKGKEARQYFIACEAKAKAPIDPMQVLADPAAMRGLLLSYTEKVLTLENKVEELAPKAKALDRMAIADGEVCLQTAGKLLQQPPNKFIAWLRSLNTWIFKRQGSSRNSAYTDKINAGYLNVRTVTTLMPDGSERVTEQVVVTPKGLVKLAQLLGVEVDRDIFRDGSAA